MTQDANDWWEGAVQHNRAALLRIVAILFARTGLDAGGADALPRHAWRRIVRLLRPAESAVRRLIVIAARGISVEVPARAPERPLTGIEQMQARGLLTFREINLGLALAPRREPPPPENPAAPRLPLFPLVDRPKRYDLAPRRFPRGGVAPADGDEPVDVASLCRRVLSLKAALDDLPAHALRLARREALRKRPPAPEPAGPRRRWRRPPRAPLPPPLRIGHPPGRRRRKPRAKVDDILDECHTLALMAQRRHPDTS